MHGRLAEGSMVSGRRGTSEAHAGVAGARGWLVGFQRVARHDPRVGDVLVVALFPLGPPGRAAGVVIMYR